MLKSGADTEKLWSRFRELKKAHANEYTGMLPITSPLEILRALVPDVSDVPEKPAEYMTDPDVCLEIEGGSDYVFEVSEGRKIMPKFNDDLRDAILLDEAGQIVDKSESILLKGVGSGIDI